MNQAIAILGALLLMLTTPGPAQAITLSDLLDGQSITVGDKLFDQWRLIGDGLIDTSGGVELSNIEVSGISDLLNPGLLFNAGSELQVTGDNFIDLYFGYRVSVLPGSTMAIKDVSFNFLSGGWGKDGLHAGIEDVYSSTGDLLGSINLEASDLNFITGGTAIFAPQSEIFVEKNILLYGFADGDSSYLNSFSQRFSQETVPVPEPSTMLLLGGGLLAFVAVRRRKGKT